MPLIPALISSPPLVGGATYCSVTDMVPEVRVLLEDRPTVSYLTTAPIGAGGVTATAAHAIWDRGRVFEYDDGTYEQSRVTSEAAGSTALTIERGSNNTTAAVHADGVRVLTDFRYSGDSIVRAMEAVIAGLWPWAYAAATQDLTFAAGTYIYPLNGDYEKLISAVQAPVTAGQDYYRYNTFGSIQLQERPGLDSATFPTLKGMFVPAWANQTNVIHVTYARKLDDSTVECGLMSDCVVWGTAARLVKAKSIPRTAAEDTTQADSSVTPSSRIQVGQFVYASEFVKLRQAVAQDLRTRYPLARRYAG